MKIFTKNSVINFTKNVKSWLTLCLLIVLSFGTVDSKAQFSIGASATNYTQNFNSLQNTGTGHTWSNNATLTGWYASTDITPSITTYGSNTGSTTTAGLYSYGTSAVAERAIGFAASNAFTGASGTGKGYIGWRLVNNTGSALSSVTVTWTGEQWRKDNTVNQSLVLTYRQAASITDLTGTYTAAGSTFTSPIITAGGAALDGNLSANRIAGISVTITVNIPAGQEIMLRWEDLNDAGNDHQLAIDDVTVNAAAAAAAPTVSTTTATSITATGATSGGNVTADGGATVTVRGVAYGISPAPTTSGTFTSNGGGTGVFGSTLSGLTSNTQYYYRAYATNAVNTSYGSESNFITLASVPNAPVVNTPTSTSLNVSIGAGDGNPGTTQYAIRETGSGNYVQANGSRAASEVWQTAATWSFITVTGLASSTVYNFDVKARNSLNAETGFGTAAGGTTSGAAAQDQTITFNPLPNVTYGVAPYALTATASSGLTVLYNSSNTNVATISGSTITIVGAGSTIITASQPGDITNWNAALNVDQTLTVDPKNLTTTGATAQNKTFNGNTTAVISGTTLVGVEPGDVVTVSGGGTFATSNAGTGIEVTANLSLGGADAGNYTLTQPSGLLANIDQASQTITFNALPNKTTADAPFALTATATSGLTVTYTSSIPAVADVAGNTVTIFTAGTTLITAQQAGDGNYLPATDVSQSQLVTPAPSIVTYSFGSIAPGTASPTAGVPVANLSISDITRGNNNGTTTLLTTTSASSGYAGVSGSYNVGAASLTGALNTGTSAYFEFTLTPAIAHQVTLTSISFGTRSTSTGTQAYTLRSSVDGFSSNIATGTIPNTSTWVLRSNSFSVVAGYNNAVTFRLYGHSGTGSPSAGTANWRVDDISIGVVVEGAPQCTGTPEAGTASADATFCGSGSTTLTLTGNTDITSASGLSIQWFVSTNNIDFTPTGVGNETSLATGTLTQTNYYYAEISCSFSSQTDVTNTVTITVTPNAAITSVTGTSPLCTGSSVTYTANGVVLGGGTGAWSSDNNAVATVSNVGLVTALSPGTANISFTISGGCGGTVSASASVIVASGAAPTVTGAVNVCPFIGTPTQLTYTASSVGATAYNWIIPPTNVTIISGQGTANLVITIQNGFALQANKQLRVTATSPCGVSAQTVFYLAAQIPSTPAPITGVTSACPFIGVGSTTYSIPAVAAATTYNWSVPANASILSGQGTTSITVSFNNTYATGAITVTAGNDCGNSPVRSITVTRNNPSIPSLISGPTNACPFITPNAAAAYTVPAVAGVTTYTWSASNGATVQTGQGTNSVTISYPMGYTNGSISVTASNGCGTSNPRNLSIGTLNPFTPSVIDVINTVACPNRQYTYTIANTYSNTTNLVWTVPDGATILSGQGITSITVSYPGTIVDGFVTVQAFNPCGQSVIRSVEVKLPACPLVRSTPSFSKAGNSNEETMDVNVYPNPTTSQFNVQVITAAKSQIIARVIDMKGNQVARYIVLPYQTLNLGSQLKAGAYIVEVLQGNTKISKRIVKF